MFGVKDYIVCTFVIILVNIIDFATIGKFFISFKNFSSNWTICVF